MDSKLVTAVKSRNTICAIIKSGLVEKDIEDRYNKRKLGLEVKNDTEKGNIDAMSELGLFYYFGINGFDKDDNLAFKWFEKGSDLRHPPSIARARYCLVNGFGIEKNKGHGLTLTTTAAGKGVDIACYNLGNWFLNRQHSLPKNKAEAKYWLAKARDNCSHKTLCDYTRERMLQMLEEINKDD